MGIFGDELLLNLVYEKNDINKPSIRIKKIKPNPDYLLTFSGVSILLSQLTVLTEYWADSLVSYVIGFIQNPKIEYKVTKEKYLYGFELSLYKKNKNFIYNQFDPLCLIPPSNFMLERDIVYFIYNYILWVYDNLSEREKKYLCQYLVMVMDFYKTDLQPIISKFIINGVLPIEPRKEIVGKQVPFCSAIYNKWNNLPILPGTPGFEAKINELKSKLKM